MTPEERADALIGSMVLIAHAGPLLDLRRAMIEGLRAAIAEEREACALLAEDDFLPSYRDSDGPIRIAAAIRARADEAS